MSKKKNNSPKQKQFIVEHPDGRPCTVCANGEMDQETKEVIDRFIADNDDCFAMFICPITPDEAKDMLNTSDEE